jgi:hypothetical protein
MANSRARRANRRASTAAEAGGAGARADRRLGLVEWAVAGLLTALAVALAGLFWTHAGALWRDEASTVWLATRPSLREVWRWLPYDHCPPMVHLAIRAWWSLGLADSDLHLRLLGFLIGTAQIAACWIAAGAMRRRPPVLLLALLGINATVVVVGASFRGYGLGGVLAILVVATMWRLVRRPGWATAIVAAGTAVLSVQCLYQDAIFVAAACCGAVGTLTLRRRWADTRWPLGVGALAAVSLLPYLGILRRAQDWYAVEQAGFEWSVGWQNLSAATGRPLPAFTWVWVALCAVAVGATAVSLFRRAFGVPKDDDSDLLPFAAVSIVAALVMFALFLETADLPTQAWYFTALMAFVAVCLDAVVPTSHRFARLGVLVFAAWAAVAVVAWGVPPFETRQTNVDEVAAGMAGAVSADDYVIVHPWYCGATFARYYTGVAPWTTLPPLEDHFLHRYDLLKVELQKVRPIDAVLQRIATTLQGGHRVWLVGWIPLNGERPPEIRPAPDNPWGWFDEPYSAVWGMQVGYFVTRHATGGGVFMKPPASGVNEFENLPVVSVTGWR